MYVKVVDIQDKFGSEYLYGMEFTANILDEHILSNCVIRDNYDNVKFSGN